jgi:hypothetical protein
MVTAMSIGDAIAVAWVAGERGGVRMRVGGVDALAKASDVVVFDDLVEGGKLGDKSVVVGLRFLPGSGYALLLLSTTRGVFAVRVSKDGAFDPLGVTD